MKRQLDHIKIIFLVSRGRSGSTLVQSILDAHPNICAPIESKFVLHLATKYQNEKNWSVNKINQFIKDLYTNRKYRLFWNVSSKDLKSLFDQYQITTFSDACKVVYLSHHSMFPKEKVELIIDKNPLYSRFIPELIDIFQDAHFIHLIRDARAATYSHFKTLRQKNIPQLAFEWKLLNEKVDSFKSSHQQLFYTLKYEELVQNPEKEFSQLFDFIKMSYYPSLLDASITIKEKIHTNKYLAQSHHENIGTPVSSSNINDWENNLSSKQITLINKICENLLIKYDYLNYKPKFTYSSSGILFFGKLRSNLKNCLIHTMFKSPFWFRTLLYNIVSLFLDRKFKN